MSYWKILAYNTNQQSYKFQLDPQVGAKLGFESWNLDYGLNCRRDYGLDLDSTGQNL